LRRAPSSTCSRDRSCSTGSAARCWASFR
jgi:hypothetical protein